MTSTESLNYFARSAIKTSELFFCRLVRSSASVVSSFISPGIFRRPERAAVAGPFYAVKLVFRSQKQQAGFARPRRVGGANRCL